MEILIARSANDIETAFNRLSKSAEIGCDTETSSLSARTGKIFSVQFSDGDFNVLVPLSEGVNLGKLAVILENPAIVKIFHNARFDLGFLAANRYAVTNFFDTMIAEKVLTKGAGQSVSLAETLYRYFAVDLEKSHRKVFTKNWNGIWTTDLVNYALQDVCFLPRLRREQNEWLARLGLAETYAAQIGRLSFS